MNTILGLDLGKFKSVACLYDPQTTDARFTIGRADLPVRPHPGRGREARRNRRPETMVVAKPGYAVGALRTRTGLTVDSFEIVFMRIKGERLDPND
jgi:hypothetical protein